MEDLFVELAFRPLSNTSISDIYQTFCLAFSDYAAPIAMPLSQFKTMITRRGFMPDISTGIFSGGQLIGFTLNGLRQWQDVPTAYDIMTGMINRYRGTGLGKKLFHQSLPVLKEKGAKKYLLEVIQSNRAAVSLYQSLGFTVSRELSCMITGREKVRILKPGRKIQTRFMAPDWNRFRSFWDHEPSWQNSIDSVTAGMDSFKIIGAFLGDRLAGYIIIQENTGDIPQIAVDKSLRKSGIGSALLEAVMEKMIPQELRLINIPGQNISTVEFLKAAGFTVTIEQYEMTLDI